MQDAGQRSPGFVLDLLSLAGSVPNDNNAPRIDFQEVGSLRHLAAAERIGYALRSATSVRWGARLCAGPELALTCQEERGRVGLLSPGSSDVDLLGYGKSVVDLNAEVAHRALDFLMPQQELHCSQITSAAINEGRFGPAK